MKRWQPHYYRLNPYGDGDCFLHATNFNLLVKALNKKLSANAQQAILDSGYITAIVAAGQRLGINLKVNQQAPLRTQLVSLLMQITVQPYQKQFGETVSSLLGKVHWGVWQKLTGEATRRLSNHALNQHPQIIEADLRREFMMALNQKVCQTRYPGEGYVVTTDRFDRLLNLPVCQQLVQQYITEHADLFPADSNDRAALRLATAPLVAAAEGDDAATPPAIRQVWQTTLFPAWLNQFANNDRLSFAMLGDEHKKGLAHIWQVNFLQINDNPRHSQPGLSPMNFETNPQAEDYFVVQRQGAHYYAGIEMQTPIAHALVAAVNADGRYYRQQAGEVRSRFGSWQGNAFRLAPGLNIKASNQATPQPPLAQAQIQTLLANPRHKTLQEDVDAALANYIFEHQEEEAPNIDANIQAEQDQGLINGFYQQMQIASADTSLGKLYQRIGLLNSTPGGRCQPHSTPTSTLSIYPQCGKIPA